MKIAIIGAGNTGLALAAHLEDLGESPILYVRNQEKAMDLLAPIQVSGALNGTYQLHGTGDFTQAIEDAEIVIICTWANDHSDIFRDLFSNPNFRGDEGTCPKVRWCNRRNLRHALRCNLRTDDVRNQVECGCHQRISQFFECLRRYFAHVKSSDKGICSY